MSKPASPVAFLALLIVGFAVMAGAAPQKFVSGGIFTVEYWPGDEDVARESLDILKETASEFSQRLPAGAKPIRVTVCRTFAEFQARAGQYGRTWVGGVSRTDASAITLKSPHLLPHARDYAGVLRHELLHVLLARNVNDANLPRWLNEGVVMVLSRESRWGSAARVAGMYASRRLIAYHELDFAFLPLGDEMLSGDAYAQALSMTQFLRDRIGERAFWEMLAMMRDRPFEEALRQATGLSPGALYSSWRASLWKLAVVTAAASAFTLFDLMILLAVLAWYRKRRRNMAILEQWDDEEREEAAFPNDYVSPDEWTDWADDED